MVDPAHGGRGVGRALAEHVLATARADGYRGMQFNAVAASNTRAVALWQSVGMAILCTVPDGFRHPTQGLTGLHIMYQPLSPTWFPLARQRTTRTSACSRTPVAGSAVTDRLSVPVAPASSAVADAAPSPAV